MVRLVVVKSEQFVGRLVDKPEVAPSGCTSASRYTTQATSAFWQESPQPPDVTTFKDSKGPPNLGGCRQGERAHAWRHSRGRGTGTRRTTRGKGRGPSFPESGCGADCSRSARRRPTRTLGDPSLDRKRGGFDGEIRKTGQWNTVHCGTSQHVLPDDRSPLLGEEVVQEKPHVHFPWVGAYQRHPPTETPSETIRNQCITIQGSFICEHQVTGVWLDATSPCRVIVFRDVADFREVETSIVGHVFYSKKHWAGIGKLWCGVRSVVQAFVEFLDWNRLPVQPLHGQFSRMSLTLQAMVCSSSRACALRASSSSFSVSSCSVKSSSLTASPGATPT